MSSPLDNEIALSFGSDIRLLDFIQVVSEAVSKMADFDDDGQYSVSLAVREAVTNAIQHGNKEDKEKKVGLRFMIFEDRLRITVRDEGQGVESDSLPDPLDPENLLKPGGRGIFFVRSFMDSVDFHLEPEGGHEVIMEKLRSNNQGEENDD